MSQIWKETDFFESVLNLLKGVEGDLSIIEFRRAEILLPEPWGEIPRVRNRIEAGGEVAVHFGDGTESHPFCVESVSNPVGYAYLGKMAVEIQDLLDLEIARRALFKEFSSEKRLPESLSRACVA